MPVLKKKTSRRVIRAQVRPSGTSLRRAEGDAGFEKALRKWKAKVRPLIEAARSSEQLSEDDLAIRINARE